MEIIQLYPEAQSHSALEGLYLDELSFSDDELCVYANFLTSLDGRIAVRKGERFQLPEALTNLRDLRLFFELRALADCVITHAGYLRDLEAGNLGNILDLSQHPQFPDLAQWQQDHQVPLRPAIIVCSNTLEFPMSDSLHPDRTVIATSERSSEAKRRYWEDQGYRLMITGANHVEAQQLHDHLIQAGHKRVYLCTGPQFFLSYLSSGLLDRLYVTFAMQFIGHKDFLTMTSKGQLPAPLDHLRLRRLLIDDVSETIAPQIYASYDCKPS